MRHLSNEHSLSERVPILGWFFFPYVISLAAFYPLLCNLQLIKCCGDSDYQNVLAERDFLETPSIIESSASIRSLKRRSLLSSIPSRKACGEHTDAPTEPTPLGR